MSAARSIPFVCKNGVDRAAVPNKKHSDALASW
jgi:hypothetical protein